VHPFPAWCSWPRNWQLKDGLPVVMLPGRVTRWKGHVDLLHAAQRLPHRDFQLVFVGDHEQKPAFRDELIMLVKQLGLQGHVQLVGDCRDMAAAFMLADVVVSASSEPEGFGRIAVEAQAMGRPVVATDHGGSRETVLPGVTRLARPAGRPRRAVEGGRRSAGPDARGARGDGGERPGADDP